MLHSYQITNLKPRGDFNASFPFGRVGFTTFLTFKATMKDTVSLLGKALFIPCFLSG